jgi:hypothetical protein
MIKALVILIILVFIPLVRYVLLFGISIGTTLKS